jgi:hypothetical protein
VTVLMLLIRWPPWRSDGLAESPTASRRRD